MKTTPTTPTYGYEPAADALSCLSVDTLPAKTQRYLLETGLLFLKRGRITGEALERTRRDEEAKFHRALLGVHVALVEHRRKLAIIACGGGRNSNGPGTNLCSTIDEIENHVEKLLISETRAH